MPFPPGPYTHYSYPFYAQTGDPWFPIYSSEGVLTSSDFPGSTPHSQGPRGGDPFNPLTPGTAVFFNDDPYFLRVEELDTGRSGKPFTSSGTRTYVRRFLVVVRSKLLGPAAVCGCPGIPLPFAPDIPNRKEEWDYLALAVDFDAQQGMGDDWQKWIVTVTYSTDMPAGGPNFGKVGLGNALGGTQQNPWDEPINIEWDVAEETEAPSQDLNKKAYVNSADQPFTPAYTRPTGYRTVTITRNERVADFENRVEDYVYVVNTATFKTNYPPGYALCTGGRAVLMWRGNVKYYRVTYKILCKKRVDLGDGTFSAGWQPRLLDAGMFQKKTLFGIDDVVGEELVPIMNFGVPVNQPVMLDGTGKKQKTKVAGRLVPVWLNFKSFRDVDLEALLNPP